MTDARCEGTSCSRAIETLRVRLAVLDDETGYHKHLRQISFQAVNAAGMASLVNIVASMILEITPPRVNADGYVTIGMHPRPRRFR